MCAPPPYLTRPPPTLIAGIITFPESLFFTHILSVSLAQSWNCISKTAFILLFASENWQSPKPQLVYHTSINNVVMCQNAKCQKLQWTVWELIDAGNYAIYRELVKQHPATANQLGSWFERVRLRRWSRVLISPVSLLAWLRCCLKQQLMRQTVYETDSGVALNNGVM